MIALLGTALLCMRRPRLQRLKTFTGFTTALIAWRY